jgi:hypothetical protein
MCWINWAQYMVGEYWTFWTKHVLFVTWTSEKQTTMCGIHYIESFKTFNQIPRYKPDNGQLFKWQQAFQTKFALYSEPRFVLGGQNVVFRFSARDSVHDPVHERPLRVRVDGQHRGLQRHEGSQGHIHPAILLIQISQSIVIIKSIYVC